MPRIIGLGVEALRPFRAIVLRVIVRGLRV